MTQAETEKKRILGSSGKSGVNVPQTSLGGGGENWQFFPNESPVSSVVTDGSAPGGRLRSFIQTGGLNLFMEPKLSLTDVTVSC